MKVKLSPNEVKWLLSDLCVKLGFCLPSKVEVRLINNPPSSPDRFADVVYAAEGLDPRLKSGLYDAVLARVVQAFNEHENQREGQSV